ncbi:MAG: hypothetical protein QNJ11_09485 [Woeseiaceae bacterium]|nr:hypothetical protein [Woeseiaceae bacterium]
MSRSPLAYPLNRAADTDVGGAADLQTDVMRFMAILSLCLVAIFALVQSIPLTPVETPAERETEPDTRVVAEPAVVEITPKSEPEPVVVTRPAPTPVADETAVVLTRPKWVPKHKPAQRAQPQEVVAPEPTPDTETPATPGKEGFVLRFASDAALTRAVAAQHVGFYAIHDGRARRMTVSESRITFWDASTPNAFHEMEATTVPTAVIDALARTGAPVDGVDWGVTLPGKMKSQLDALMQEHQGGSLLIGAAGDIHWESL